MGLLIQPSDFTGKYQITESSFDDNISAYIDDCEERYLIDMLGRELFDLFKADVVDYLPQSPIYLAIYNALQIQWGNNMLDSYGMKKMLLGFVFFEYTVNIPNKQTMNGNVNIQTEVSQPAASVNLYMIYNKSINNYQAIQLYCRTNIAIYPKFLGVIKKVASYI